MIIYPVLAILAIVIIYGIVKSHNNKDNVEYIMLANEQIRKRKGK